MKTTNPLNRAHLDCTVTLSGGGPRLSPAAAATNAACMGDSLRRVPVSNVLRLGTAAVRLTVQARCAPLNTSSTNLHASSFRFRHSFVIWHSSFVILTLLAPLLLASTL